MLLEGVPYQYSYGNQNTCDFRGVGDQVISLYYKVVTSDSRGGPNQYSYGNLKALVISRGVGAVID